jgi:hypothetical protein
MKPAVSLLTLALLLAGPLAMAMDGPDPLPDPIDEALRRFEELSRRLDLPGMQPMEFPALPGMMRWQGGSRLGAQARTPDPALASQLDLPSGQGLVLEDVLRGSPADKAGMKKHDILLELAGKPVSSRPSDLGKLVASLEAGKDLEAVVLRKGKKVAIKGLKLPEAAARPRMDLRPWPWPGPGLPEFPRLDLGPGMAPRGEPRSTTVIRENDRFTATDKAGSTTLVVKGSVTDGKPSIENVTIEGPDGKQVYDSVEKVPEAHRKRVEALGRMATGQRRSEL